MCERVFEWRVRAHARSTSRKETRKNLAESTDLLRRVGKKKKKKEPKRWHLSTLDPISYLEWRKTTRKIYWRQHTHGCLWNTARKTTSKMMFTHRQEQFAGVSISVYILYTIHAVYLYLSAVLLDTGHIWWLAPFCLHQPTWFYFINAFFTIQQPEIL